MVKAGNGIASHAINQDYFLHSVQLPSCGGNLNGLENYK
jgi:hypothetical protein